jgi:hypothetical protein
MPSTAKNSVDAGSRGFCGVTGSAAEVPAKAGGGAPADGAGTADGGAETEEAAAGAADGVDWPSIGTGCGTLRGSVSHRISAPLSIRVTNSKSARGVDYCKGKSDHV